MVNVQKKKTPELSLKCHNILTFFVVFRDIGVNLKSTLRNSTICNRIICVGLTRICKYLYTVCVYNNIQYKCNLHIYLFLEYIVIGALKKRI